MKTTSGTRIVLTFIILLFLGTPYLHSQEKASTYKIYKTWIRFINQPDKISGCLYEVKDSSVSLSSSMEKADYKSDNYTVSDFAYNDIIEVYYRKKGNIGIGAISGFGFGFLSGFLIGYAQGDDPPCDPKIGFFPVECMDQKTAEDKAILTAIPMSFVFAGIGAAIGSARIKVTINGKLNLFLTNREKLNKRAIKKF